MPTTPPAGPSAPSPNGVRAPDPNEMVAGIIGDSPQEESTANSYNKIGMMSFIMLSIIGMVLPFLIVLADALLLGNALVALALPVIFTVLFVLSYMKIRKADGPGADAYLFILVAPAVIYSFISLFMPGMIGIAGEFVGVVVSYFYLSGKNWFD